MAGDVEVRQARPAGPGLDTGVRRRRRQRRRAGQQRRHHGRAVRADRRRLREPDRHQSPRPLRADQPAAAQDHRPGGHGVVDDAPAGLHQPQGPELEVAAVLAWPAYGQSKLANLLFTSELQRRLDAAGSPLRALAAHPGYSATNLQGNTGNRFGTPVLGHRQPADGHRRRLRRPPDAVRGVPGPARRQLHRAAVRDARPDRAELPQPAGPRQRQGHGAVGRCPSSSQAPNFRSEASASRYPGWRVTARVACSQPPLSTGTTHCVRCATLAVPDTDHRHRSNRHGKDNGSPTI